MGIESWSTTAASNNSAPPNGAPEGMAPSAVNDTIRKIMADLRLQHENAQWINYGYTHTYASSTSVTVSGVDVTAIYPANRRIKAVGSSTGTIYGKVASSSFSTNTTITFIWDSGSLSNESLTIAVGILTPTNSALPNSVPFTSASASGPASLEFAEDTDNGTNKVTLKAPSSIASDVDITLPGVAATLATLAGTETLTNKKLSDSTCTFADESDATKQLAFQCSGITTATTRTVTIPDKSGTMAMTSDTTTTTQATPANPTGTTSATAVMMGLASAITPVRTGKLLIIISGNVQNTGGGDNIAVQLRYGTGAAPSNGAAATGTAVGGLQEISPTSGSEPGAFSLNAIVSGLSLSTAYWIDITLQVAAGTATAKNISVSVVEI